MRGAVVFLCLLATGAAAEGPRSVIPWLSESLLAPDAPDVAVPEPSASPSGGEIEMSPLGAPVRDGAGLLSPQATGFPPDLWQETSALRVRRLIAGHPGTGVPSTRELFHTVLIAEATPPPGAGSRLLLQRIDRLMADGRLEEAEALIETAGIADPEIFRRAFDIGLLTDRSERVCTALAEGPALSPTLPARIFCLARAGDWAAAELTLSLGVEIGALTPPEEDMLARFLDPQLFEDVAPPPVPKPLTTLDFVLRDAIALPRPNGALPPAFLHIDLRQESPMRARILAAERLVRETAVPAQVLLAAYRAGVPAASGGIWDRAAAIQRLDAALETGSSGEMTAAVLEADTLFSSVGLRRLAAVATAPLIRRLDHDTLPTEARKRSAELLLLARDWVGAVRCLQGTNDTMDRFLSALAQPGTAFDETGALPPLKRAAARGLTRPDVPSLRGEEIAARLSGGAYGAALLETLALLAPGTDIDPGDFETGLWLLRKAGLTDWARRIAVETLLLLPEA
ncbi:MAG: hypothetical protein AAF281_12455 [Pseudomonadota bacterium]